MNTTTNDREPRSIEELMEGFVARSSVLVPDEAFVKASRERLVAQRTKSFFDRCPAEFAVPIDRRRMRAPAAAVDRALSWRATFPGVWLWSEASGQGKTRVLWQLYRIARVDLGKSVLERTGQQWADEVWHHHMEGKSHELWGWLARWDVLVFDDLDKVNIDDQRQVRALREVFDLIRRERMPAVVTTNRPPEWVESAMGGSAERRVVESFTAIRFE
jgi:hypothetical protein